MAKRLVDIAFSVTWLVLTSPLLILLVVAVKLDSPGPVLYRGTRVGRYGKPFKMLKFRTMVTNADKIGGSSTADNDPRITSVGKTLRKYKLDELPQLINVLRGEMSLVGPRPEVQQYVDAFTEDENIILDLRPGITDWASLWNSDEGAILAGSDDPDRAYEELIRPTKISLQLYYAQNHSLWADLKIIVLTILKIIRKDLSPREIDLVLNSR